MTTLKSLLIQLANQLTGRHWRCATAESCTGGLLSAEITALAGASAWFEGGIVTYSNACKTQLLNVEPSLLATYGAVSEQVVEAMAKGLLNVMDCELGIAISGLAGPDGGTSEKPVGLVWLGFANRDGDVLAKAYHFNGDRQSIRHQAVNAAVKEILAFGFNKES